MAERPDLGDAEFFDVTFSYDGFEIVVPEVPWDDRDAGDPDDWVNDDVLIEKARAVLVRKGLPLEYDNASVEVS